MQSHLYPPKRKELLQYKLENKGKKFPLSSSKFTYFTIEAREISISMETRSLNKTIPIKYYIPWNTHTSTHITTERKRTRERLTITGAQRKEGFLAFCFLLHTTLLLLLYLFRSIFFSPYLNLFTGSSTWTKRERRSKGFSCVQQMRAYLYRGLGF